MKNKKASFTEVKIIKLKGGLGNQLFQVSFGKCLEKKGYKVKYDSYCLEKSKNITHTVLLDKTKLSLTKASIDDIKNTCIFSKRHPISSFKYKVTTFFESLFNSSYYLEKNKIYKSLNFIAEKYNYFDGYWQSWKYPFFLGSKIYNALFDTDNISSKSLYFMNKFLHEESVFVGIRKGDYCSTKKARKRFGTFSNNYYLRAMEHIKTKHPNAIFYIFTNDLDWCKRNIKFNGFNIIYREKEDQVNDLEELLLMSSCKHGIIVNSTFHWWGAYLIKNPKKIIICPSEWFADGEEIDICPDEWIKFTRDGKVA